MLQKHRQDWADCQRCHYSETRKTVVLVRGKVPCDVLFIGEAPGESEDVLGVPFIGPAGKLLDQIIADALPDTVRYAMTNLVACIPRDDTGAKFGEPMDDCIEACRPRLQEMVVMCKPKLVVLVGTHAKARENWVTEWAGSACAICSIHHPAYILRSNIAQRALLVQRATVTIATALEDL